MPPTRGCREEPTSSSCILMIALPSINKLLSGDLPFLLLTMISRAFSVDARISLSAWFRAYLYNSVMVGKEGEPREELLSLAKAHGYHNVTDHKLARWRRAGVLPRP